ncbi:hypothetical protein BGW36DRAFT_373154 [Talaromyces proteolyticus]|uniref:Large ribosomal subunit protein eL39 n=1 Tax=Talaromyces proteolyticus TaxID=1131652 RepID=A0AAD4Q4A3_9EURO|nr:uncharacterized protein BGW36DRAFT_373154 [Talaromyces proteolyticus]KAH8702653.1 hypothetical protein BGW36DRAFT_373154 [Talaromyces proteolyticus]
MRKNTNTKTYSSSVENAVIDVRSKCKVMITKHYSIKIYRSVHRWSLRPANPARPQVECKIIAPSISRDYNEAKPYPHKIYPPKRLYKRPRQLSSSVSRARQPIKMPSQKSFRTKQKLAKAQKQNRPIPQWIRLRTGNTIR